MRKYYIVRYLVVIGITLIMFLGYVVPTNAETQNSVNYPSPITDVSKAVPFSHPIDNTVNPVSPYYSPASKYGDAGTRFGPPGQKSADLPFAVSPLEVGHRYFGTGIISYTGAIGFYAMQKFWSSQNISSGTTLYAPTLMGADYCSLEIVTRYYWNSGVMQRQIAVYDHNSNSFVVSNSNVSNYLNSANQYAAELLWSNHIWNAMIYNFSTSTWEVWYTDSSTTTSPYGFDIWEEYNFNESSWPSLVNTFDSDALKICFDGGSFTYITSAYGNEQKDVGTAPYTFKWVNQYYHWYVK